MLTAASARKRQAQRTRNRLAVAVLLDLLKNVKDLCCLPRMACRAHHRARRRWRGKPKRAAITLLMLTEHQSPVEGVCATVPLNVRQEMQMHEVIDMAALVATPE